MNTLWRPALCLFCVLSILTGIAYPLLVTGLAQLLFPRQANGSLVVRDGTVVGSTLIGQNYADPKFFWGRPSAAGGWANNGLASGGSNQGPLNPAFVDGVKARVAALKSADPSQQATIPLDLVTASGSGLDPDISPAAAHYQAPRVARLRGINLDALDRLIVQHTRKRQWGFLGETRVNVLELNLALDTPPTQ
jgi:K+-transporting ATPase ATPase C chain